MTHSGLALGAHAPAATRSSLIRPLRGLANWALARTGERGCHEVRPGLPLLHPTVELAPQPRIHGPASRVLANARNAAARCQQPERPLRVILHPQEGACRIALSGRMADVCAELDRLALA